MIVVQNVGTLFLVFFLALPAQALNSCRDMFVDSTSDSSLRESFARDLSHDVATASEKELHARGFTGKKVRGYAILIGAIVGVSAMNAFVSTQVFPSSPFLSVTLATTLGTIVGVGIHSLGGPIIEPIASKIRQMSFETAVNSPSRSPFVKYLEDVWLKLQQRLSLNAQMSRNGISQFIISIQQNFFEAYRAVNSSNPEYAADQVAVSAFRLRLLFREIPPNDPSVQAAVRAAFTNHVKIDSEFMALVWQKLEKVDPEFSLHQSYYEAILKAWLIDP